MNNQVSTYFMVFSKENFTENIHTGSYAYLDQLIWQHKRGMLISGAGGAGGGSREKLNLDDFYNGDVNWKRNFSSDGGQIYTYYSKNKHLVTIIEKKPDLSKMVLDLQGVLIKIHGTVSTAFGTAEFLKSWVSRGFIEHQKGLGVFRVSRQVLSDLLCNLAERGIRWDALGKLTRLYCQMYARVYECSCYEEFLDNEILANYHYLGDIVQGAREGKNFDLLYYMYQKAQREESVAYSHIMRHGNQNLLGQLEFCLDNLISEKLLG
jgi:hypothetical protein